MYKECRFVKPNGLKCGSPALRGSPFCYFHARNRVYVPRCLKTGEKVFEVPPLVTPAGIHQALSAIIQALACGNIDPKRAGKLLYALQIAQKNLDMTPSLAPDPIQSEQPLLHSQPIPLPADAQLRYNLAKSRTQPAPGLNSQQF